MPYPGEDTHPGSAIYPGVAAPDPVVVTPGFGVLPERRPPRWQYILCNTPDPLDPTGVLEEIGEIESARNRSLEIVRNRAGTASCSISVYDDFAKEILDRVSLGDVRGSLRKSLLVRRNKIDLWSGPIASIQGSLSEGSSTLTLQAIGWLEYLFHRFLDVDKHYEDAFQNVIAYDLLNVANAQDPDHPVPVFAGVATGVMRNFSPTFSKGDSFGASIQKLSDVESGFDMDVDPRTRALNIYAWDSYRVLNDVKLGYRWGPGNIVKLDWTENGTATRNRLVGTGSNGVSYGREDTVAQDEYGIWEESISIPDAPNEIIAPFLEAELVIRSRPQVSYSLTPKSYGVDEGPGPRLFDDFTIGDQVSFTAREGHFSVVNQAIRVFGASVSIEDNNVETVNNLMTTPSS